MDELKRDELDALHGASTVVIHPGSLHLRIGRASDPFPKTVPHCIAWKHKKNISNITPWLARKETWHNHSQQMINKAVKEAQEQLTAKRVIDGKNGVSTSHSKLMQLNECIQADESDVMSQIQWTNVDHKPEYVIADDALYLNPESGYQIIWPFAFGDLNLIEDPGYSITSLKQSLKTLWIDVIENLLEIPAKDISMFKCILLIPDIFQWSNVRHLMDLLMEDMGFSSVFTVQESVCASFGSGLSSACIVDIGDQKTSISCVEDGMSLEKSRITLKYGGRDITRTFHWLLDRISFPYANCLLNTDVLDALLMQELKHAYCHMEIEKPAVMDLHFQVRPPNQKITKYTMQLGDERILASLAVFWPEMFGLQGHDLVATGTRLREQHDPTDTWDASYITQTRSKQEESARLVAAKKKEIANQSQQDITELDDSHREYDDELIIDTMEDGRGTPLSASQTRSGQADDTAMVDSNTMMPLDQAILWSIDQCETDEVKKRMYSNVVVVGGGLMFEGVDSLLQYRIWLQTPSNQRALAENLAVTTRPKDLDPQTVAWKGGALLSLLDTTQELWIQQKEWLTLRTKVLRERAPFIW